MRRKSDRFLQITPVLVRTFYREFLFLALSVTILLLSSFHCPAFLPPPSAFCPVRVQSLIRADGDGGRAGNLISARCGGKPAVERVPGARGRG